MYVKPLFSVEPSDDQAESDEKSEKKQARRSKQERGNNTRDEKVATVSDEGYQSRLSRKESPPRRGGGEDMEALKQKKIEEIRNKLISERASQGIQPYKQNKKVEEEVKPTVVSHKYNSREPVERSANSKEIKGH